MAELDWQAVVASGFLATLAMTLTGYFLGAVGLTYMDLDQLVVRPIRGARPSMGAGVLVHVAVGVVLTALYAVVWRPLVDAPPLLAGLLYGAALWLAAMAAFFPLVGRRAFATDAGPRVRWALLAAHVVYGTLVGVLYPWIAASD